MAESARKIWIGPSGWSYPDWAGLVYPDPPPRGFQPLRYLSQFVNAVEVNTSFYRIPTERMTASWTRQVPAEFRFAFKLTRSFTHERAAPPSAADAAAFRAALRPVREAGLLGPLLIQFPWSFRYAPAAVDHVRRLAELFPDEQRFVEVRHASWATPDALAALRDCGGYCNIDQPQLRDCLGPTAYRFGADAYVRLHGRNGPMWFAEGVPGFERYNYLYSEEELREWVTRMNELAAGAENVYTFANNHYRGQGVANAVELRALLTGEPAPAPRQLIDAFPRLAGRAVETPRKELGLFGEL